MITDFRGTLALSAISATGTFAGTLADATIGVDTPVSLGSALTCASVVVGGAWWIGRKFKAQDIMHRSNKHRFDRLEKTQRLICKKLGINLELIDDAAGTEDDD